ncbi:PREDICTED: uncharacterized protein LOC105135515 isoform X2 [Populus euphratica]|uniref:Uncharacterized protein LOC105135515 isoform X2 n=1 Tax=Populus euphratica TaxID=75702 RepID=A0AAJ6Y1A4_POPEU|nr:PREDICTED: uncharacterized protein LOC105135515 isoform X2 [Populus euphratica]
MGKAERERLNQSLSGHLNTIHETLQLLDQTPAPSLDKLTWDVVVKMGDQVSKQATIAGMLWIGETPEAKAVEENMATYFNTFQGLILLSHGSMVAVSVKDVLREMEELKPVSSNQTEEASNDDASHAETRLGDNDSLSDDLGNDLSPEEMKVAQSAIGVVSETVVVMKELIRTITGLLKQEKPEDSSNFVDTLEKLLKLCQEIGVQIDELGACLYPPQEFPAMKAAL